MEFSREVYHLIVRHVGTRSDLIALSTVSKRFQQEAERSLYNTLHLRGHSRIMRVCHLLSSTPRLSVLVEALSIFVAEDASDDDSEEEDEPYESAPIPDGFWQAVAAAFRAVDKLRFLSVYFEQTADTAHAWVLNDCRFQLRTFHCDFEWDQHMAGFLRAQHEISDLCLADFRKDVKLSRPPAPTGALPLPKLSILECTFSEAAMCLVPGRPVVRVKTCFSRTAGEAKTAELGELLGRLKQSRRALRALDLADEAYTEDFSLELLAALGGAFARFADLRYLGTLVLPVDGKKRVHFYRRLLRFPRLRCVELEVSEWEPPPMTPAALRALTYELRIYCPSISRVIFVYDFDRAVMQVGPDGSCVLDPDAATDTIWREV